MNYGLRFQHNPTSCTELYCQRLVILTVAFLCVKRREPLFHFLRSHTVNPRFQAGKSCSSKEPSRIPDSLENNIVQLNHMTFRVQMIQITMTPLLHLSEPGCHHMRVLQSVKKVGTLFSSESSEPERRDHRGPAVHNSQHTLFNSI
jgi:hypothetical protein